MASEYSGTFYEDMLWQQQAANMLAPQLEPGIVTCKHILLKEKDFFPGSNRYACLSVIIMSFITFLTIKAEEGC